MIKSIQSMMRNNQYMQTVTYVVPQMTKKRRSIPTHANITTHAMPCQWANIHPLNTYFHNTCNEAHINKTRRASTISHDKMASTRQIQTLYRQYNTVTYDEDETHNGGYLLNLHPSRM
eukprot:1119048_1